MTVLGAIDWATVSSLATALGTLVLAVATFAAVRSSNRSARIAELALQEQRRPLLSPSRFDDPVQKVAFMEGNWFKVAGGRAVIEHADGSVYLVMSLRNVGNGIGVLQGWNVWTGRGGNLDHVEHTPVDQFRLQARDLYVPAGDIGLWQGALRNPDDATRVTLVDAIADQTMVQVELLYSDHVGRERTITRFGLSPVDDGSWIVSVSRHWYLDWSGPRDDDVTRAAADAIRRDRAALDERRAADDG